jgi:hypothetical protein
MWKRAERHTLDTQKVIHPVDDALRRPDHLLEEHDMNRLRERHQSPQLDVVSTAVHI